MARTLWFVLTLICACGPARAQEKRPIPPWPYRQEPIRMHVTGRLQELQLTLVVRDWTLEKLLGQLTRSTRLTCRSDKTIDTRKERVTLIVKKTRSLRWILDRLVRGQRYDWVLDKGDVVLTTMPHRYPPRDAGRIRRQIEDARFLPKIFGNLRAVARRNRRLEQAIAGNRISHPALRLAGPAFLKQVPRLTGLPVKLQPGLAPPGQVVLPAQRVTIAAFLDASLKKLGLEHTVHRGRVVIGTPTYAKLQRQLRAQSQELLAQAEATRREFLERKVTLAIADLQLYALAPKLAEALSVEVYVGPNAWKLTRAVTLEVKGATLASVASKLAELFDGQVRLVVAEGKVYLLKR